MSEDIVINKKADGFTVVPTKFIQNSNISMAARMTAIYLYSKPDGWRVRPSDVQKNMGFKVDKWKAVSRELRKLGLIIEKRIRSKTILEFKSLWDVKLDKEHVKPVQGGKNQPLKKSTVGKTTPLENKDVLQNKDILKNHDHNDFKNKAAKPPIPQRIDALNSDERYVFQKLVMLQGMFRATALNIVETHPVYAINNVLEMAVRDGVKSPGAYVTKSLLSNIGLT